MKKTAIVTVLLLICASPLVAADDKASPPEDLIKPGPYEIGYLEMRVDLDSSIALVNEDFRTVTLAIWYPDVKKSTNLAKKEVPDRFPVIVLCPGVEARLDVYMILTRYLSGHGFIVATFPSSGNQYTYGREIYRWEFRELQQEYLKIAATKAGNMNIADPDRMAVMGHSYGGPAAILFALSDEKVDAVVSLDGTDVCADYTARMAEQFPAYNPANLRDPFLLILADASYCTGGKRSLDFFEGITGADACIVELFKFRHEHFAYTPSFNADPEVKQSFEIACLYLLNFFKAHLYGDVAANDWLQKSPEELGLPKELFELKRKMK